MSNRYGKIAFLVALIFIGTHPDDADAKRRQRGRRGKKPGGAVAVVDANSWPSDNTEMMIVPFGQSNSFCQAVDATSPTVTALGDADILLGGDGFTATLDEYVNGQPPVVGGANCTGTDVEDPGPITGRTLNALSTYGSTWMEGATNGGTTLANLSLGGSSGKWESTFLSGRAIDDTCTALGGDTTSCWVGAIAGIHGESDEITGACAGYGAALATFLDDAQTAIVTTLGYDRYSPKMFINSTANAAKMDPLLVESACVAEQTSIAISDADIILCSNAFHYGAQTSNVFTPVATSVVHNTALGHRFKGEHFARCIDAYQDNNYRPSQGIWLYPSSVTTSGNNILVDYAGDIPCEEIGDCGGTVLTFDTTNVDCPHTGNQNGVCRMGFEWEDDSRGGAWINGAPTISGSVVTIPLSAAPTDAGQLSYMRRFQENSAPGNGKNGDASRDGSQRGNLRDTTTTLGTVTGSAMVSWANVVIDHAVTGAGAALGSLGTWNDDITHKMEIGIRGEDCPAASGNWTEIGISGGSAVSQTANSMTCSQDTGGSATEFGDSFDAGADNGSNEWFISDQTVTFASDEDVMFFWAGCAKADSGTDVMARLHLGGADYFRVFQSGQTLSVQFDTSTSVLLSQNLTTTFPAAGEEMQMVVVYLERFSDDQSGGVERQLLHLWGDGDFTSTSKNVDRAGIAAATPHWFNQAGGAQQFNGETIVSFWMFGQKARSIFKSKAEFKTLLDALGTAIGVGGACT